MQTAKVQHGIDFLRQGIEQGRFSPGTFLPPVRRLALSAQVSPVTICKALAVLRREGVVVGARGQRPKVKPSSIPGVRYPCDKEDNVSTGRLSHWERLAERIRADLYAGTFPPGSALPTRKELLVRYATTYHSLNRALHWLCGQSAVRPHKKGFAVPVLSLRDSSAELAVMLPEAYFVQNVLGLKEGHDYLSVIESVASRARVRLRFLTYREERLDPDQVDPSTRRFLANTRSNTNLLGFVYVCAYQRGNFFLVNAMMQHEKPLSILSQNTIEDLPGRVPAHPLVRIFPVGIGPEPGRRVARFLLELGHRHVAYVSASHHSVWSTERCRGVREVLSQVDPPGSVTEFTATYGDVRRLSEDRLVPSDRNDPRAKALKRLIGPATLLGKDLEASRPMFEDRLWETLTTGSVVKDLLTRALSHKRITAWVAANDSVGAMATDFLRKRRIDVPGDISIVSFDNNLFATAYRLTSYDLDIPSVIASAFNHVFQTPAAVRLRDWTAPGMIVERGTTGTPRPIENRRAMRDRGR